MNNNQSGLIICGQILTGRLEVLEAYFKGKANNFFVIGISSVFANSNSARMTIYKNAVKFYERPLFNLMINKKSSVKGILFIAAYAAYLFSAITSVLRFRKYNKSLVFVGIGLFPAITGVFLKKLKLLKKVVYYSIDYFPAHTGTFLSKCFVYLDKICVKNCDFTWSISTRVIEARREFAGIKEDDYRNAIAPLTFDSSLLKKKKIEDVDRWSIVFVGTSGYLHGLHLLIEAVPELVKIFPGIKIKVIGPGPWDDIKSSVNDMKISKYFDFLGFIKDETEMSEVVAKCALGVALYVPGKNNPTFYADPGKPKLYAFCSVPVVISKTPLVAMEIDQIGAGKAVEFDVNSFIKAVKDILSEDAQWQIYRNNAYNFAQRYTTEKIFNSVFTRTMDALGLN